MNDDLIVNAAKSYANENSGNLLYTGKEFHEALIKAYIAGAKMFNEKCLKEN